MIFQFHAPNAAGQDYTRVSDTFTAPSFTSRRCIDIPILDDNDREPNERFAVILRVSRSLSARDYEAIASVEIEDDDRGRHHLCRLFKLRHLVAAHSDCGSYYFFFGGGGEGT